MKRLAVFGIAAFSALIGSTVANAQESLKTVTLVQPVPHIDIRNAPWAVADEKGWLAEEGLKVEIQPAKGATVLVQQLLNGSAQYGMPPPENAVIAFQKGAPLKFIFSFTSRSPFPLAVLEDSPYKTPADFKDKNIGLHSMTAVQYYTTQAILGSAGLKLDDDFKFIAVGAGPAALQALQSGQIAALSTNVLNYAGFVNRGAKFRYISTPQIEPILGWSLMTTTDYLEANREEAIGIARAFNRGQLFCREQPVECVKTYFKKFPQVVPTGIDEEKAIADQVRVLSVFLEYAPKPEGQPWGYYDPEAWKAVVDYMLSTGQIEAAVDPANLYTNALIEEINAPGKSAAK